MTKTVVTVGFLVAFAAGLVVGLQSPAPEEPKGRKAGDFGSWLATELKLTPEQQQKMHEIWSETARRGGRDRFDRRRELYKERDEAIAALIRPEDRAKYDEVLRQHADRAAAMEQEWRRSFESAVQRTREILTDEQRARYEQILERHRFDKGPHDRRRGDGPRDADACRRMRSVAGEV